MTTFILAVAMLLASLGTGAMSDDDGGSGGSGGSGGGSGCVIQQGCGS